MFHLLSIFSIISTCFRGIKEAVEPTTTVEQWANKDLCHQDIMNGVSAEQRMKNLKNGKYYIPKEITQAYPVPHREEAGKRRVIIENCELHREDVNRYGAYEAYKWVDQGKYNLTAEEFEIPNLKSEKELLEINARISGMTPERKARLDEINEILATKKLDYKNTEAAKQWQQAHDAESKYK